MVPPRKPEERVGAERSGEAAAAAATAVSLEQAWQGQRAQRGRRGFRSGSGSGGDEAAWEQRGGGRGAVAPEAAQQRRQGRGLRHVENQPWLS